MPSAPSWPIFLLALFGFLLSTAAAADVLSTDSFQSCMNNSDIKVQKMHLAFDRDSKQVIYDLAGTSERIQTVMANLDVSVYGKDIKNFSFDPCTPNKVDQLCPVPKGTFAASGHWTIPDEYVKQIPDIAWNIPNLDGESKVQLISTDGPNKGKDIACYSTHISNSKSFQVPAVSWVAATIAGAALVVSGLGAVSAAAAGPGAPGAATPSPTFGEVIFYFQGIATNGMLSVNYPSVYRSFTQNFAFSTGLIPFGGVETGIDNFRASTGGNLTGDSVADLNNSTLVFSSPPNTNAKRSIDSFGSLFENVVLAARDNQISTNINGTNNNMGTGNGAPADNSTQQDSPKQQKFVTGVQAFAAAVSVPNGNTFMTALLIFAIILAAVIAGILLFKVILEAWALFGKFPQKLASFRKNYWWLIAKTITNLILLLYGVWVLYCVYQFRAGDSWAASVLAGVTLAVFTAVLAGFTIKIVIMAQKFKRAEGNAQGLYKNKETWRKYSIFYDNFKKGCWWMFVPAIIFMFAKGVILAGTDGSTNHSLAQTAALLIVDSIMLLLLLFLRPYELPSGNWINIVIQVVRVISVVCVLVFVEQLGFDQTTKTVTGVVLIVVQGSLTAVLGILIAINAIINCVRMNPHRKARKDAEKQRDLDTLTPLDAHNSLLMYPMEKKNGNASVSEVGQHQRGRSQNGYDMLPLRDEESKTGLSAQSSHGRDRSTSREPMLPKLDANWARPRSESPLGPRQPQLPDLDYGHRHGPGTAL